MIKVRRVSAFFLRLLQIYHTFAEKVLANPLTAVYTVYVDWVKGNDSMHVFMLGVCWGAVAALTVLYVINYLL